MTEKSIIQGIQVLEKGLLKETAKLKAVIGSKEGIEEIAIEGSKQTIKQIIEKICNKERR